MTINSSLTADRVRHLLGYDPDTGFFTWKVAPSNSTKIGSIAGSKNVTGYIQISIGGRLHLAHRLAWLYMTGEWPEKMIDHINCVRDDNRFSNLRTASPQENQRNSPKPRSNTSGFKGVSFIKAKGKWYAQISIRGKGKHLGCFDTPQEAHQAYCAAAEKYHGSFARFS